MAPVVKELEKHPDWILNRVCVTAQHRQMLDQVLTLFGVVPDYDLDVMQDSQSPTLVAAAVLAKLEPVLQAERPDWVLVRGDTITVVAAALAAFHAGAKVATRKPARAHFPHISLLEAKLTPPTITANLVDDLTWFFAK